MSLAEDLLYWLAKRLYRTEVALTDEMKESLESPDAYADYRSKEIDHIVSEVQRNRINIAGAVVLDFGCADGAISQRYLECGAAKVIGVDINPREIERARTKHTDPRLEFHVSTTTTLPLPDQSVDVIISYDVFEHVEYPEKILRELKRVLRPGGQILIGTWGWRHPFASHLWSTMPVPWAHVFFSEKTVLAVCRRVYHSPWYKPCMHDLAPDGSRLPDKYTGHRDTEELAEQVSDQRL
jgi:2-polyprenyl-3-methyl-5-hydroxy-6-metoxy-1,4-benzoquinol methylase